MKIKNAAMLLGALTLGLNTAFADDIKCFTDIDKEYAPYAKSFVATYQDMDKVNAVNKALADKGMGRFNDIAPDAVKALKVGDYEVEYSIYYPKGSNAGSKKAVIFYQHCGGFLFRNAYYEARRYKEYALKMDAVVVVTRYSMSYERVFPAALEECYSVLSHILDNASEYNVDTDRVFVMGDSAGGNLSAALPLVNKDKQNYKIAGQILIYPMLDYKTGRDDEDRRGCTGISVWDAPSNVFAWDMYRGGKDIKESDLGYFSPSHADDLSSLPPAFIYIGDMDLFASESLKYASKLIESGNKVQMYTMTGMFHLFEKVNPEAAKTDDFYKRMFDFVKSN